MKNNIYTKDLKDIKNIFRNFWKQTKLNQDEPVMYMFSDKETNTDWFKHCLTRQYIKVKS
tara:strand:- start:318 stop:497 length:180 start_codon:yes stop_codon:yes gene_type:complete